MRLLIDTHVFLWFVNNTKELSSTARNLVANRQNLILISIASLWELSIKTAQGKLTIDGGYERVEIDLNINSFEILPINFQHTLRQNQLTFHHRDPFDRMIAAQALVEKIDLVSSDMVFDLYFENSEIKRIW
jgi:PIN domain nuclease of toxin-antitoxin system